MKSIKHCKLNLNIQIILFLKVYWTFIFRFIVYKILLQLGYDQIILFKILINDFTFVE